MLDLLILNDHLIIWALAQLPGAFVALTGIIVLTAPRRPKPTQ